MIHLDLPNFISGGLLAYTASVWCAVLDQSPVPILILNLKVMESEGLQTIFFRIAQ